VMISLDASQQTDVKAGDTVTVTLPDGTATPGVISSVGTVATSSSGSSGSGDSSSSGSGGSGDSGGSGGSATIPVHVRLTHPKAAGHLDQAPVTVNITTATTHNALVVPVSALLARPDGSYAVETTGPANTRHLVRVTVGIFDDADGLVQVTGTLTPGQHVVVPSA
jgi:multidrug efflux pump subunit AcrA (membrane-fusion protein)